MSLNYDIINKAFQKHYRTSQKLEIEANADQNK